MKIYVSGKIGERVISDGTRRKFEKAKKGLEKLGHEVFVPTSNDWQAYLEWNLANTWTFRKDNGIGETAWILHLDVMELMKCDAIYMLEDWLESPGAKTELAFAQASGIRVLWEQRVSHDGLRTRYREG